MHEISVLDPHRIPRHVAIIMDGNVTAARKLDLEVLTLYAFSTENWKRPSMEVQGLMALLKTYLKSELDNMLKNNISLRCLGDINQLPVDVRKVLDQTVSRTANHDAGSPGLVLNLALSYGSRAEIVRAARIMAEKCEAGQLSPADITEELLTSCLYTAGLPDPDLLIRTGGESRLSNFRLWQASYAEIYITETMWPDFGGDNLIEAIRDFQNRERRFGKTGDQVKTE